MQVLFVRCLLVMSAALSSCRGDDESLEDMVRTLRGQVSALLERRQEDYKLLEESLKNELEKNSQLSSLRDEVETLRRICYANGPTTVVYFIRALSTFKIQSTGVINGHLPRRLQVARSRRRVGLSCELPLSPVVCSAVSCYCLLLYVELREVSSLRGNQQKNDHLTLQWLSSSVTELRAELTELAVAQNASAELQRRQETESELHLLRGDSAALRRETEELRADVQKGAARAEQVAGDAEAARKRSQAAQVTCADLSQQHMGDQKVISVSLGTCLKVSERAGFESKSSPPRVLSPCWEEL
uniref:Uncharacterized protein n=1 Tax=Timema tahoe TaxID=61484 RepID=A0A7R9FJN5_9NEOP|nr:unnamed protein product [Timema tahoe]